MGEYTLVCRECGSSVEDAFTETCPRGCSGLLRTVYEEKQLMVQGLPGLFRYHDWLPVDGYLHSDAGPVTYRSEELGRELGLSRLSICFNGWWPEKRAKIPTCSFKELEARPTAVRMQERGSGVLLVASAGNTGRAFAQVSAETGLPIVLVIPEKGAEKIWATASAENLLLITIDGDYTDAIHAAGEISRIPGIVPEGGAKNPARRDGIGTVMLDGAVAEGRIPDWYVQAASSGTGGIAAWEAAERLIEDGRWGSSLPRLLLSQNEPFVPMKHAWDAKRRDLIPEEDMPGGEASVAKVWADVLTSRSPPWSIPGGVFDALSACGGSVAAVATPDANAAGRLFAETEGIDIDPAAAVAVASLMAATEEGSIAADDHVLLNITGGGYERIREDFDLIVAPPTFRIRQGVLLDEVIEGISEWVRAHA